MEAKEEKEYLAKWTTKFDTMSANELTSASRVYDLYRLARHLLEKNNRPMAPHNMTNGQQDALMLAIDTLDMMSLAHRRGKSDAANALRAEFGIAERKVENGS